MDIPRAQAVEANGVDWLVEQQDGGTRCTTTYRRAYVEVTMKPEYAHDVTPLSGFASAVKKTAPVRPGNGQFSAQPRRAAQRGLDQPVHSSG